MNIYSGYYFGGMQFISWIIWMGLIFWIFFTPWSIPGERRKKNSPLGILQKRFVTGYISEVPAALQIQELLFLTTKHFK